MDKKVDPIEAVEMSWRLTKGHGWTIFFMGFVSIFIVIFGLILLIIGIFPAIIWVWSSFATLYQSILKEKEKPAEPVAEAVAGQV
jgi:NhaP-type Na+/H+ or K+/H+ antiporter